MTEVVERLARLKFMSCTCDRLRGPGEHEPPCPTDVIHDACTALRSIEARIEELEGAAKCSCSLEQPDDGCVFHAAKYAEVRRVAFEDAARIADEAKEMRQRLFAETRASLNASKAAMAEQIAEDIRTLSKGTGQ